MSGVTSDALEQRRITAANFSGGVSSGPIHEKALKAAAQSISTPRTILDFGSGQGRFLSFLATAFPDAELHAADIVPFPAGMPATVKWHRGDLNLPLPIDEGTFDLICAIEVIEHLENPRAMMREMARLLRVGGRVVITTPNTQSLRSLLNFGLRGHHAFFDDANYPAHIMPLALIDIERAAKEAGLVSDGPFYTDDGMIPKFVPRRWQTLPWIGRRLKGRLFSDNFGIVLRKP